MKLLRKKHMKDFLIFVICIIGACLCGIVSEPLFFSILNDVSDSKELTWDLRILIAGIGIYYLGLWLYFEIASAINLDKYDKFGLQASLDDEASGKFPNARIILTKNPDFKAEGAIVVHSVEEALEAVKEFDDEKVYVIGGDTIYKQFLPYCNLAHVTKIAHAYEADTYFPNLDEMPEWEVTATSEEQTYFDLEFEFIKYERSV